MTMICGDLARRTRGAEKARPVRGSAGGASAASRLIAGRLAAYCGLIAAYCGLVAADSCGRNQPQFNEITMIVAMAVRR